MEYIIWSAVWTVLCYRLAKRNGLDLKIWTILGVLFGPFTLIAIVLKKKYGSSPSGATLTDQAVDRLKNIRYSVDNISSKLNEKGVYQSSNKIGNALKDIFKKR
jgi:hypothetical protein